MCIINVIGADLNPLMSTYKLCAVVLQIMVTTGTQLNVLFILRRTDPLLGRYLEIDQYSCCYAIGRQTNACL
jgi:hypothetical protein